jgi:hypothetical protein
LITIDSLKLLPSGYPKSPFDLLETATEAEPPEEEAEVQVDGRQLVFGKF